MPGPINIRCRVSALILLFSSARGLDHSLTTELTSLFVLHIAWPLLNPEPKTLRLAITPDFTPNSHPSPTLQTSRISTTRGSGNVTLESIVATFILVQDGRTPVCISIATGSTIYLSRTLRVAGAVVLVKGAPVRAIRVQFPEDVE